MWQFPEPREEAQRFFVLGLEGHDVRPTSPGAKLIACGALLSDDGSRGLGAMALVQAEGPGEAKGMLTAGGEVEVRRWEFGGRPDEEWPDVR